MLLLKNICFRYTYWHWNEYRKRPKIFTMVIMPPEIILADKQVMVLVQFPELAIDHVKVFVREVVSNLVYVIFFFQQSQNLQQ